MSDNNNGLPETPSGVFGLLFNTLPKQLRLIVALVFLCLGVYVGYHYYMPKPDPTTKEEPKVPAKLNKPVTIVGKLIGMTLNRPLANVLVNEKHNPMSSAKSTSEGLYILENIVIPESKIISLTVTYSDGTVESVKDIDVSQIIPDTIGRLMIPDKLVKDTPTSKANPVPVPKNHYESKDNSKQINVQNNNGPIIIN